MKPRKDAKLTVRGLGPADVADGAAEDEAPASESMPPASRAVTAVPPRLASERSAGRYSHVPPRRQTREVARAAEGDAAERGRTLRPAAPADED